MSDWGATHNTSIVEGLDQEMPGPSNPADPKDFFGVKLQAEVENGTIPASVLDRSVARILTPLFAVGLFDAPNPNHDDSRNVSTPESMAVARELAENSTILLQNRNGLIPISAETVKRIVIVGQGAKNPIVHGGGSGLVDPSYLPPPLAAISGRFNQHTVITYSPNADPQTVAAASAADLAIVFVGTSSAEGSDRQTLSYGPGMDGMVSAIAAAQPKTIVVATSPGAVLMPWASNVSSILLGLMPGQMFGDALANLLFGDVAPSGRLPITIPNTGEWAVVGG